jgi:hypothetical protein
MQASRFHAGGARHQELTSLNQQSFPLFSLQQIQEQLQPVTVLFAPPPHYIN